MPWKVVERRIGRVGGVKQRTDRQRQWDQKYGKDNWQVGYVIDGTFVTQEDALESIYYRSYEEQFAAHPEDLHEMIGLAKQLRNPHADATTGVDLQVPVIMAYLELHGLQLQGNEVVNIGSCKGQASHPISVHLSPLYIKATGDPKKTQEQFWQEKKCLAVWQDE